MKIKIIVFVIFTILISVVVSNLRKRETRPEVEENDDDYNGGGGIMRPNTPNDEVPNLTPEEKKVANHNIIKRKNRQNRGGGITFNNRKKSPFSVINRRKRKSRKADIGTNVGGGIYKDYVKGKEKQLSDTNYLTSEHNLYKRRRLS